MGVRGNSSQSFRSFKWSNFPIRVPPTKTLSPPHESISAQIGISIHDHENAAQAINLCPPLKFPKISPVGIAAE